MSSSEQPSAAAGAAYGVLASLIWAGFPAITKLSMASDALTAWDVTALRFLTAGVILLPIFWKRGLGTLRFPVAVLLACGAGAPYVLLTAGGLAFAPAGHMGVITPSCMLLCSTVGSWLVLGDKPVAARVAGVLTIFLGLVMLGWDGLTNRGESTWIGDVMFLVAGMFWATYTIGSRVWKVEPFHATVIVAVFSMIAYLPVYGLHGDSHLGSAPWSEIVLQAVFQGVLSALVALLLYTRAVEILGAARGAVFAALVPSFALLIAIPVLDEVPTPLQTFGVVLVTAGMVLSLGLLDPARWRRASRAAT